MTTTSFVSWPRLRTVVVVALAILVILVAAPRSSAHAALIRSVPANGAVLTTPPKTVELWFSESVTPRLSHARLVDSSGHEVSGARVTSTGRDSLVMSLPSLPKGTFSVLWQVLSRDDGHASNGAVVFVVGAASAAAAGSATGPALDWRAAASRWLVLGSLAALVGSLALAALLRPRRPQKPTETHNQAVRRLRKLAWRGAQACLVGFILTLMTQATVLAAGSGLVPTAWDLLTQTPWGRQWVAGCAALVVLLALLRRAAVPRGWLTTSTQWTLLAVVMWTQVSSGHAASLPGNHAFATFAMAVHVASACIWVGGVLAVGVVVTTRPGGAALLRENATRVGLLLAAAAALLTATGLYSAGRQVPWVTEVLTTAYGRTLLAKLALFALLATVAAANAVRLHGLRRQTQRGTGQTPRARRVLAEAVLGLLVIGAAAVLVETPPARVAVVAEQPVEQSATRTVEDLVLVLSGTPSRPGANAFTVLVGSTRRPAPAPIDRVQLQVTSESRPLAMTPIGPDRYFATATLPDTNTSLTARVVRGGRSIDVTVPWTLAAAPPASDRGPALAPWADALAVGLLLAVAGTLVMTLLLRYRDATGIRTVRSLASPPGNDRSSTARPPAPAAEQATLPGQSSDPADQRPRAPSVAARGPAS